MKRHLMHEDKELFVRIKSDLKQFTPYLETLKKTYLGLEMGKLTSEVMKQITTGRINPIESKHSAKVEAELDKTGITIQSIRDSLTSETDKKINLFKKAVSDASSFRPQQFGIDTRYALQFSEIGYDDSSNTFIVDPEAAENILENECRIYLETKEEDDLYNALSKLIIAQDEVKNVLAHSNYVFSRKGFEMQEILAVFLRHSESGETKINPSSIKYAIMQSATRDRIKKNLGK